MCETSETTKSGCGRLLRECFKMGAIKPSQSCLAFVDMAAQMILIPLGTTPRVACFLIWSTAHDEHQLAQNANALLRVHCLNR